MAEDTYEAAVARGLVDGRLGIRDDFLRVPPFPVDSVIGNPPYVRLRFLPLAEREQALVAAREAMAADMESGGSTWMPFVLHASRFLRPGGRMAWVLPYELTHVRYARPLWTYLGEQFGELRVVRVRERMFPDILQETVVLFADWRGKSTDHVTFDVFETVADFVAGHGGLRSTPKLHRIVDGERPFLEALLPTGLQALLHGKIAERSEPLEHYASFGIGYVSGDKEFFHPSAGRVRSYRLPDASLRPALASGREVANAGLLSSGVPDEDRRRLFLPAADEDQHTDGERRYVRRGERDKVHKRYKTRIREPWFVVPGVTTPDLLLPVFSDVPRLLVNDAELAATNSYMGATVRDITAKQLASRWYTSLTLLQAELRTHALGGGVFVFVPRELNAIRIPRNGPASEDLTHLDRLAKSRDWVALFQAGDDAVLGEHMELDEQEIALLREGAAVLRRWRSAA